MAGFSTKGPRVGAPSVGRPKSNVGGNVRFQKSVRPPTQFPHLSVRRRDYSKPETGAEQPLGFAEGERTNFGSTGLTGET